MGGMQGFGGPGMAMGGRRGMSDVAWHPDNVSCPVDHAVVYLIGGVYRLRDW